MLVSRAERGAPGRRWSGRGRPRVPAASRSWRAPSSCSRRTPQLADALGAAGRGLSRPSTRLPGVLDSLRAGASRASPRAGPPREAGLRHPALRPRGERRSGDALPAPGGAPGPHGTRSRSSPPGPSTTWSGATTIPGHRASVNGIPVHRSTVKRHAQRPRLRLPEQPSSSTTTTPGRRKRPGCARTGPSLPSSSRRWHGPGAASTCFLFYCYRYYHTCAGLPARAGTGLLVPTAEEDPAIGLGIFKPFFRPRGASST